VFTARCVLSPYVKQIRFVFEGLMTARSLSRAVKRPGPEANHSPPSSCNVKNEQSHNFTPPYTVLAYTESLSILHLRWTTSVKIQTTKQQLWGRWKLGFSIHVVDSHWRIRLHTATIQSLTKVNAVKFTDCTEVNCNESGKSVVKQYVPVSRSLLPAARTASHCAHGSGAALYSRISVQ
jgi:hypothetical protein